MTRIFILSTEEGKIAVNVDNQEDADRLLAEDAIELTAAQIKAAGITGYEHIVCPDNTTVAEDGTITFQPPSLAAVKAEKKDLLKIAFEAAAETAHCPSSFGFEIDANDTANRNVASLIRQLIAGVIETATFRDYNNQYHPGLTLTDLNTIQGEIDANGSRLYAVKWAYEQQIAEAKTIQALEAITFTF